MNKEKIVKSELGPIIFGLRIYEWRPGSGLEFTNKRIWFTFDEKKDIRESKKVLKKSRQMAFELQSKKDIKGRVYAYLGRPHDEWDDNLSIEMFHSDKIGGKYKYYAEGGKKKGDKYGKKKEDEDVGKIRKENWCASKANVNLYIKKYGEEKPRPVLDKEGNRISTRVGLKYDGDYQKIYNEVLSDFQNLRGDLGSRFQRFAEFQKARQRAERSFGLELYKRLRDVLPKYQKVLGDILRDPATELTPTVSFQDLNPSDAEHYLADSRSPAQIRKIRQAKRVRGRRVPTRFINVEPSETSETPANRYVAGSVSRVLKLTTRVKRHLEKERELSSEKLKGHNSALRWLRGEMKKLNSYRRSLPNHESFHTNNEVLNRPEFIYEKRYKKIHNLTRRIDHLLSYVDKSDLPFEVEAFNVLYEKWCFFKIIESLEKIGFDFVKGYKPTPTPFHKNPIKDKVHCKMKSEKCENKVLEVWYEKKYNAVESKTDNFEKDRPYGLEKRGAHRSTYSGGKNKPDISLEFHEHKGGGEIVKGKCPQIIILDPTLGSPKNHRDKYDYRKAIRKLTGKPGKEGAKKVVKASWGISPMNPDNEERMVTVPDEDYWRHGFICLRPDNKSTSLLHENIENIFSSVGIYD